ncbi:MAG: nucleotide sugar dehydrogenase [Candidatus Aminicenantales bacterium]
MNISRKFQQKIKNNQAVIGVIGLGYVGLPLVIRFAEEGFRVLGFDIDPQKVDKLNRGQSYIRHIPGEKIAKLMRSGRVEATTKYARLKEPDAVLICVPTPLNKNKEPDLSYIEVTSDEIAKYLRRGQLISLESTTYPGTTREILLPKFERNGLKAGRDFFLVFSPEREDPGNPKYYTKNTPKVVGGITRSCLAAGKALYTRIVDRVVPVSSPEAAEFTKILENTFRSVNIALVNELKILADKMGVDLWEVIDAASTKPFGFMPFYPGPGLGGHCIPIDPFYLSWKAKELNFNTRFIELAGEINTEMPEYVISRTADALNQRGKCLKGAKILILGIAYKKDIDDMRESPALEIIALFTKQGAKLYYNDPFIPKIPKVRKHDLGMASSRLTPKFLSSMDAAVIVTDHTSYDYGWIVANTSLIVDTRNATKNVKKHRIRIVKA